MSTKLFVCVNNEAHSTNTLTVGQSCFKFSSFTHYLRKALVMSSIEGLPFASPLSQLLNLEERIRVSKTVGFTDAISGYALHTLYFALVQQIARCHEKLAQRFSDAVGSGLNASEAFEELTILSGFLGQVTHAIYADAALFVEIVNLEIDD